MTVGAWILHRIQCKFQVFVKVVLEPWKNQGWIIAMAWGDEARSSTVS
jgi:hypothetical protein